MVMLERLFDRIRRRRRGQPADASPAADDPRGGFQSREYRHADPRDLVEEGGTVMSGPGGAPQEGTAPRDRRERTS